MKKNMRFAGILSAAVLSASLLAGCGSSAYTSADSAPGDYGYAAEVADDTDYYTDEYGDESGYYYDGAESGYSEEYTGDYTEEADLSGDSGDDVQASSTEQKLIVTWNLSIQTEKYDQAMTEMRESIANAGGYIESEDESSYSENDRYNYLTIRIPSENAEAWIEGISEYGTVVSRSKSTEDVTLTYVDMESRLDALRTEQSTLLEMMESADNMTDIITIQSELASVNADIESYESQIRVLDNQVNYTTVYVDISEVNREVATTQTFGQELKETFLNSMEGLGRFGRNLAVGILGNSVIIILVAALVVAVILIIKKIKKHHRAKRAKAEQMTEK